MHIRKMRNIAAGLLLAMALMVQLIPIGRAAGTELRITTPETVPKAGETFTVTVDISGNPGFGSVQFAVPYDSSAMICTKASAGSLLSGTMSATNAKAADGAMLAAASDEAVKGDGRLAVFTFSAQKDLTAFNFDLNGVVLTNETGERIQYTVVGSTKGSSTGSDIQKPPEGQTPDGTKDPLENPEQPDNSKPPEDQKEPIDSPDQSIVFMDMTGHWAEEDVKRAAELGIIGGYEDGTFKPDNKLTRAQFVTILYRQAGRPAVTATTPFTDIAGINQEFQTAIAWAHEKKLVDGTSPTTFNPNGTLSRQATMKILFQHSGGTAGAEQMFYGTYDDTFADSGKLADWARTPMYWGVYNTLIEAGEGNVLNPAEPATRAQLARSMVRYIDKFGGDE